MSGGPKEINAELIGSLPDTGPVVMVNLVRYRDRAYGDTNISRFSGAALLLRMTWFGLRKLRFHK